MSAEPLLFGWDGEAMVPHHRFTARCDQQFVAGGTYALIPYEPRSQKSHDHFFAVLTDAWENMPEDQIGRFPTVEHLRKWCLIRSGYANKEDLAFSNNAEAVRFIATMRAIDSYRLVTVNGNAASIWTAQSQSKKAMGAVEFQRSKDKVLAECARLIGVDPTTLRQQAGKAA